MHDTFTVAVKAAILRDGRWLAVHRSPDEAIGPGTWEFAGGKLAFGETPEEAIARELREETGLSAAMERTLYVSTFFPVPGRQVVIVNYLMRARPGEVELSEEHDAFAWVSLAQMRMLLAPAIVADMDAYGAWAACEAAQRA